MPQVKKRCRQTGVMLRSTVAFTTALSNDREVSSTPSTSTIQRTPSVPITLPVSDQPSQPPNARQIAVKMNEPL
jgi:hypothetical protein